MRLGRDVHNKPLFPIVLNAAELTDKTAAAALIEKRAWGSYHEDDATETMGGYDKLLKSLHVRLHQQPNLPSTPFFFVSSDRFQAAEVRRLKAALSSKGVACLSARELYLVGDPATWSYESIGACVGVIACLSDKYLRSHFCLRELANVAAHAKPLVPVVLDDAVLTPSDAQLLQEELRGLSCHSTLDGARAPTIHHFERSLEHLHERSVAQTVDAIAAKCSNVSRRYADKVPPKAASKPAPSPAPEPASASDSLSLSRSGVEAGVGPADAAHVKRASPPAVPPLVVAASSQTEELAEELAERISSRRSVRWDEGEWEEPSANLGAEEITSVSISSARSPEIAEEITSVSDDDNTDETSGPTASGSSTSYLTASGSSTSLVRPSAALPHPPEDELEECEDSEVGQSVGFVPPGVAHRHSRIARARSGTGSPQARQHKWLTERLQPSERLSKASDLPANLTAANLLMEEAMVLEAMTAEMGKDAAAAGAPPSSAGAPPSSAGAEDAEPQTLLALLGGSIRVLFSPRSESEARGSGNAPPHDSAVGQSQHDWPASNPDFARPRKLSISDHI